MQDSKERTKLFVLYFGENKDLFDALYRGLNKHIGNEFDIMDSWSFDKNIDITEESSVALLLANADLLNRLKGDEDSWIQWREKLKKYILLFSVLFEYVHTEKFEELEKNQIILLKKYRNDFLNSKEKGDNAEFHNSQLIPYQNIDQRDKEKFHAEIGDEIKTHFCKTMGYQIPPFQGRQTVGQAPSNGISIDNEEKIIRFIKAIHDPLWREIVEQLLKNNAMEDSINFKIPEDWGSYLKTFCDKLLKSLEIQTSSLVAIKPTSENCEDELESLTSEMQSLLGKVKRLPTNKNSGTVLSCSNKLEDRLSEAKRTMILMGHERHSFSKNLRDEIKPNLHRELVGLKNALIDFKKEVTNNMDH